MNLQILLPQKSFKANGTTEGHAIFVDEFMSLQGLALLKCFITLIALKRLLPCVCSLVRYQMCILGKSPPTFLTTVRAFPTVRPVMFFQVWLGAETLGTYGALVGLLTCVGAFVLGKLVLSGEALPTDITLVRALTSVGSHVDL